VNVACFRGVQVETMGIGGWNVEEKPDKCEAAMRHKVSAEVCQKRCEWQ